MKSPSATLFFRLCSLMDPTPGKELTKNELQKEKHLTLPCPSAYDGSKW